MKDDWIEREPSEIAVQSTGNVSARSSILDRRSRLDIETAVKTLEASINREWVPC